LDPDPPTQLRRTLDAIRYLESETTRAFEGEGLVLRYGAFYGPGTGMLDRSMIEQLRRRRVPLIGEANGWWSFLHIDDAAAATAIYNIVDDEPAPVRVWLPALAALVGAKPPLRLPKWLGRLIAGEHIVMMMTETRASSNAKTKRDLSWRPMHVSWRQGFAEVLAQAV
jgi:2-alkyl-3-oxoalkanoate reductase